MYTVNHKETIKTMTKRIASGGDNKIFKKLVSLKKDKKNPKTNQKKQQRIDAKIENTKQNGIFRPKHINNNRNVNGLNTPLKGINDQVG